MIRVLVISNCKLHIAREIPPVSQSTKLCSYFLRFRRLFGLVQTPQATYLLSITFAAAMKLHHLLPMAFFVLSGKLRLFFSPSCSQEALGTGLIAQPVSAGGLHPKPYAPGTAPHTFRPSSAGPPKHFEPPSDSKKTWTAPKLQTRLDPPPELIVPRAFQKGVRPGLSTSLIQS